jgi:hypothetical protein
VSECSVYLFGYPHGTFGHVVKVGISNSVYTRLASIQSHNPNQVIPHFHFDFPSRDMAYAIEQSFHRRFTHCSIRGEWFGMGESEALFMLSMEVVSHLSKRYEGDAVRGLRKSCGLLRAFEILDAASDENHEKWNNEWMDTEEAFA